MRRPNLSEALVETVHGAGRILMRYHGRVRHVRQKGPVSSVVCEADLASEQYILRKLRSRFPDIGFITEESGYVGDRTSMVWVVDPLDGTSNFVAGLPWFGVQIGLLKEGSPVLAAMYLPVEGTLYVCEAGCGVHRNGKRVRASRESDLKQVLCAFGFDAAAGRTKLRKDANLLMRVASGVRNTRTTNSLFDFCYGVDGRLGGCINLNCKIWDIVPVCLMLPEAGGILTDLQGKPVRFDLGRHTFGRTYAVAGAGRFLHRKLMRCLTERPRGRGRPTALSGPGGPGRVPRVVERGIAREPS